MFWLGLAPAMLLMAASLMLVANLGSAHAASSVVTLDPLPSAVYDGDLVVFSGTLTGNGVPLPGRTVWICEDDPFIPDECLARTTTDNTGRFRTVWTAQAQAVEIDLDIYAEFDGDGSYRGDQTIRYTMSVYEAVGLPSATVTLSGVPSWVYAGDTVVFAGTLTGNGVPLPGRTVWICEDDPFIPDECLVHGTTDSRGQYRITWTAEAGAFEVDFDVYAEFDGDGSYGSDQTSRRTMSVYKYGGSITLDPIPERAAFGEIITLTGTLRLDAHNPEGSIVYIKDEDTLNPDDLLVSAYVETSGRFTTFWVVEDVDPDYTIDIQAVYEGGPLYYRQATPIQKLTAYNSIQEPGPEPGPVDGGYMELYRSLNFEQPPRVAIVPSPDSYEQVRRHIVPVREGILGLTAMLEQRYPNGDWNVDFEVVQPGGAFDERPDVIVDLVTRDDDSDCDWDRYEGGTLGWAYFLAPKPVPTVVCSLDSRTNEEVGATAVHEFVHAVGLGHTFNIPGDLMCSVEDGQPTCPGSSSKSTVFSELNLAAVAALYGTDGFQNPNNDITHKERFALGGYQNGGTAVSQQEQGVSDGYHTAVIFTDYDQYKEGEVILVDGVYTGEHRGSLSLYLADRHGDVVNTMPVTHDVIIEDFFLGLHPAGTYTVWLYDEHDWVKGPSIVVSGVDDAVIYADDIWYYPGEPIYLDGFYWGSYNGWSELRVLDPLWDTVVQMDIDVVDDFFGVHIDGRYVPGRYLVLLYDDLGWLAASTAFHVLPDP